MKRIHTILIPFFVLMVSTPAVQAKDKVTGPYISLNGGFSFLSDSDVSFNDVTFSTISFDPGFSGGGAFGYDFDDVRTEIEVMYRRWDMDTFTVPGTIGGTTITGCPCSASVEGDVSSLSFMLNGYSIPPWLPDPWELYLGGGLGMANVDAEINVLGDDSDTVFAYQFMIGLGYDITTKTALTIGYRFFDAVEPEFQVSGVPIEAKLQSHDFNLGLRFTF
ncbi:outer membrane protein [Nitrospina watsonii]|uniref:Surface antigen msp4 family protein n=1 Tax=Nitrospina watsonii TaxID=1323948 RepID=A0ABM9HBV9_9BACT|nr:outer membrane beta-barrel protein [Nitrospina watsonii]CAI2717660.1 putative Surface antigen msp4 family protein [Nitrospina watsonii]